MPAIQTNYNTRMRTALNGMMVDMVEASVISRVVNEVGGLGFAVAVSQDLTADRGVRKGALGAGGFIGLTVRDVTMDGTPVLPTAVSRTTTDTYDQGRNAAIMTRGRAWVTVDSPVVAFGGVYFDNDTGQLGGLSGGRSASGSWQFVTNPVNGNTITANGVTFTFIDSGTPSSTQALIGSDLAESLANMVTTLNASVNGSVSPATYEAYPNTLDASANQIRVSYDTAGTAGNAYTLATNVTGATVSGSTLSGGAIGDLATGSIVFTINPTDGQKITLNGTDVVFADTPSAGQVQIGGDLATTLASAKTLLNASANAQIAKNVYDVTGGTRLTLVSKTSGTTMNAYTLATNVTGATVSGATMTGGTANAILITGAKWLTTAQAGDLAQIGLSLQY
jgi:hypothetical protein